MADVRLRIEVNPNHETTIDNIVNKVNGSASDENVSNASLKTTNGNYSNIRQDGKSGYEGLGFDENGLLYFNESGYLDNVAKRGAGLIDEQNPIEYVWGVVPSSKEYEVEITLVGDNPLTRVVIYGDRVANQFPTEAYIDGNPSPIYSDDATWYINLGEDETKHTIRFTKWNRANYNACISLIRVMLQYYDIRRENGLKSISVKSQSTGQSQEVYYNSISGSGNASIIDVDGEILEMANSNIISNSNMPVKVVLNYNEIQSNIINNSSYIYNSKQLDVQLVDALDGLDNIQYLGRNFTGESTDAYSLLCDVLMRFGFSLNQIENMCDQIIVFGSYNTKGTVQSYLSQIYIKYPFIYETTLREAISYFCTMAQLSLTQFDNGEIKFISARPIITGKEDVIVIPSMIQKSVINSDLILKNKYQSVYLPVSTISDSFKSLGNSLLKIYEYNFSATDQEKQYFMVYDKYTYVLSNSTIENNPVIVLYKDIEAIGNLEVLERQEGQLWYYNIVRFQYNLDNTVPYINEFKWNATWDYLINNKNDGEWVSSEYFGEKYSLYNNDVVVYEYDRSDKEIISDWITDYDGKTYVAKGAPNNDLRIRINKDGSADCFCIMLSRIMIAYLDFGTYPDPVYRDGVNAIYHSHNFQIYRRTLTEEEPEDVPASYDIELQGNSLIQSDTVYQDELLSGLICKNISSDFRDGIMTGNLTVACGNLYNPNGELIKDWSRGQILSIGDIVRLDNDNSGNAIFSYNDGSDVLWRVVGREFKYDGVPLLELELQEARLLAENYDGGLYSDVDYSNLIMGWEKLLKGNLISINEDMDTLISIDESLSGYLKINTGITTIYKSMMANNSKIKSIQMNHVKYIEAKAFDNCDGLESIELSNVITVGYRAFGYCDNLKTIKISNSVKSLGDEVFRTCRNATNVTIGTGLSELPYSTFAGCDSLTEVNIPSNIKTIGEYAFAHCDVLNNVTLNNGLERIGFASFQETDIIDIIIPSTVWEIDSNSFYCENLNYVEFKRQTGWTYDGAPIDVSNPYLNALKLKEYNGEKFINVELKP